MVLGGGTMALSGSDLMAGGSLSFSSENSATGEPDEEQLQVRERHAGRQRAASRTWAA